MTPHSRFVAGNLAAVALTGGALLWLSRDGSIDFAVARLFFDPAAGNFPLKDGALLAQAGHTALRWLVISIWLGAVALLAASWRIAALRAWRARLVYFSATVAVCTLLVSLVKMASAHSCPWDLAMFGGQAHWFPLLGAPEAASGPGRCWPGAHSASGFSLVAGYFAFRDGHRAAAWTALGVALALGTLMGLVQVARGAHFLTHNLWSLWIAWLCCLAGYVAWRKTGGNNELAA